MLVSGYVIVTECVDVGHYVCVLNSLLERPIYSTKNLVNGNEAHLLDERLGFGPAVLLHKKSSKWDRPIYFDELSGNEIVGTIYHIIILINTEKR